MTHLKTVTSLFCVVNMLTAAT